MKKAEITAEFKSDIEAVWNVITNNSDFSWRSDLERVEVFDDGLSFTEYPKSGNPTEFTIVAKEPYKRYEFKMENKLFTGNWLGLFNKTDNGGTVIRFIENIYVKNPLMRLIAGYVFNIVEIQQKYVEDLKQKLGENGGNNL